MTNLRNLALLLAATTAVSASAQQQRRKVPLHEALQLAAKQGPDAAAARAQAAVAHAAVDRAWTAWQPDLSANGTYDHTNGVAIFDLKPLGTLFGLPQTLIDKFPPPTQIVAQNNWYGNAQ